MVVRARSRIAAVQQNLALLYRDYPVRRGGGFADFHVSLWSPGGLRRVWKPQARLDVDGEAPFLPLPLAQAFAFFEWGLNWCIAHHEHRWLSVHAAVLERNGQALVLPGRPGAGKSTLAAALMCRGWRLMSDEFALFDRNGAVTAMPKPISLKGGSIALIREFSSDVVIGPTTPDTAKGPVAHMRLSNASIEHADRPAACRWIVFPEYKSGSATLLGARSRARTGLDVAGNSFNYSFFGVDGFRTVCAALDRSSCYDLVYSSLPEAIAVFDRLASEQI